jgi:flagellar protein FliO/FliZ
MKILVFCFLFSISIFTESEMDKALQNELGISKQTENQTQTTKKEEVNPVEERFKPKEESSSLLWTLFKIIFVFGILTALMYYVLKFVSNTRQNLFPVKEAIRVLSATSISPNKQLQIVEVSGMLFLIGVSDYSISLIKEIEEASIKQKIFLERDSFEPPKEDFGNFLASSLQNFDIKSAFSFQKKSEEQEESILNEIKSSQANKLDKLKKERESMNQNKENFFE